jgi:hypothetical protein
MVVVNCINRIFKDEFHLGRIQYYYCKHCGVYLTETIFDFTIEQMKGINKEFRKYPVEIKTEVKEEMTEEELKNNPILNQMLKEYDEAMEDSSK